MLLANTRATQITPSNASQEKRVRGRAEKTPIELDYNVVCRRDQMSAVRVCSPVEVRQALLVHGKRLGSEL